MRPPPATYLGFVSALGEPCSVMVGPQGPQMGFVPSMATGHPATAAATTGGAPASPIAVSARLGGRLPRHRCVDGLSLRGHQAAAISSLAVVWAGASLRSRRFAARWQRQQPGRRRVLVAAASGSRSGDALDFGVGPELVVTGAKKNGRRVKRTGVLLINIGTPASTSVEDVRDYLDRFLSDDRVIELEPPLLKWLVLRALLATRPHQSATNYKKVWDARRGSPLLFHTKDLVAGLQHELGDSFVVRLGMRYSEPFVGDVLKELATSGVDSVLLCPMFPHYASGTTGSCVANAYELAAKLYCTPFLSVLPPFYSHPAFILSMRDRIREAIGETGELVDHLLFSFHGVPVEQCSRTDELGTLCHKAEGCCDQVVLQNRNCYRAQCMETARLLARELGLESGRWSVAFQSRLTLRGTVAWIRPYTDEAFVELAKAGVRRLAVVAPSFTADCIETLEELGMQGKEEFEGAGGEELVIVPCLNSCDGWVRRFADLVREQLAEPTASGFSASPASSQQRLPERELEERAVAE